MINKQILGLLFFCIYLLNTTGCIRKTYNLPSEMPDVSIPYSEINSRISLSLPEGLGNSYKNGDALNIMVKVISNDQVIFNTDYGVRIFTHLDGEWKEIKNSANYTNPTKILLSPAGNDPFKRGLAGIAPKVDKLNKEIPIRIILMGNIYQNGEETDKQTGAYIDVILKP